MRGSTRLQQLLRAAALAMMSMACLGLLAVMAADYWVASDLPLPTHRLIRRICGPLLESRRQRWFTENVKLPNRQMSVVQAALAAAVLGLCCKQRCWVLCKTQPQPSQLVVTFGWMIVAMHSAKYLGELLLTNLSQNMPWMAVHHAVAMGILGSAVWESKCISVALVMPYLLHELQGAGGTTLTNMGPVGQIGAKIYNTLMFIMLGWHLHCGAVQRITSLRVGTLIGLLMATNYASYCTELGTKYCLVHYDESLNAFYALAEGQRPWIMKMWAGLVAFSIAVAALTCIFAAVCVVVERIRQLWVCNKCGSRKQLLQLIWMRANCCGNLVAKVPSKVH
uniref:Uncharacterized protein n=1 Tax=Tetradesmus obliquus TaxID=3088 RepID=A0A383WIJ0_TETOB|eukprot:jgi/Sobl393_1/8788/SZX77278.1